MPETNLLYLHNQIHQHSPPLKMENRGSPKLQFLDQSLQTPQSLDRLSVQLVDHITGHEVFAQKADIHGQGRHDHAFSGAWLEGKQAGGVLVQVEGQDTEFFYQVPLGGDHVGFGRSHRGPGVLGQDATLLRGQVHGHECRGIAAAAVFHNNMDRALGDIDQSMDRFREVQAVIGARRNTIDTQLQSNEDLRLQLKTIRSQLEDADIINRLTKLNKGPLPDSSIRAVFRELASGSRALALPAISLRPVYSYPFQ